MPVLNRISNTLAAQYLSTITGNAGAITALSRAPQTISGAVALGQRDLRPYATSNPYNGAVLAATYVGLIVSRSSAQTSPARSSHADLVASYFFHTLQYLTILAFNIVMANFTFRQGIQRRLKLSSLIAMRICVPIVVYLWLSLMFSLLNVAFKLDFNGWGRGYGAGFMVFWMVSWTAMSALGIMLEAIFSLVGPQFIAFGLIVTIVTNVSGALLPPELSPSFYKYSYAFPYYNIKSAFLILFVNAGR